MSRITKAPDERRSELIAAAQHLFFTKGYEKTSIKEIVNAVGVAKGLFYYYFGSKQAVLEALVEDTSQQAIAIMHPIIVDRSLSALEKWVRAFDVVNSWKLARRDEMLGMLTMLANDENVLLKYKMTQRTTELLAPEFSKIIVQGVGEGVFDVADVENSAEIILAIFNSARDIVFEVILNPNDFSDPIAIVKQKMLAIQQAIERVLGAQPNSLPLLNADETVLHSWFYEPALATDRMEKIR